MRASAAVFRAIDAPLEVEEVDVDAPRPGEVLVRVVATGVCHTDALARHGDMPFPPPGVLGHEGAGVVEEIGEGVESVSPGDRVVIGWPWCGTCPSCLDGQPRYCAMLGPLVVAGGRADGSVALRRASDGAPLHSHFFGQSSFAGYALCAASSLVRVPDDAPLELVGPLACGIGTGAGAVLNVLRPPLGSSVAVYGAGAVGLSAVMAAQSTGATRIVAVDRHARRLELARDFGATHVVNVADADPVEAVHDACGGPADFVLECTGVVDVLAKAAESVGMRGTCALVGGAPAGASFTLDHQRTLWGKRVVGILGGEGRSAVLIGSLLELHRQGRFPFDRLVTVFPLDQVEQAIAASASGAVVKPVLRMPS